MDRWIDGWTNGVGTRRYEGRRDGWMIGWTGREEEDGDGWMDGQIGKKKRWWTDGWVGMRR